MDAITWFKIDDNFWGSAKRMACTPDAIGLWATAGSWCSQQLTDGFVPKHVLPVLGGTARLAQKLVSVGLWEEVDDGWHFHDWSDYQPTKAAVEAERSAARERMRSRRVRRSAEDVRANSERSSESVRLPRPVPSRPSVPNGTPNDDSLRSSSHSAAKRGARLPDDWQPSTALVDQMHQECPGVDLRSEHRVFADYWAAQPGQKGVKADWDATWRNWMRKAVAGSGHTTQTARTRPSTTDAGIAAIQAMKNRDPQRLEIA